ncbi:MAG: metallophosphoesterase family protein [Thermoleophilia bacterium]|jgi:DNA repair exonuclease SbcCD nuclease subunit
MRFIHTADWQIGKPFGRIADAQKRSLVQQERIEAIKRIARVVQDTEAEAVLVAGDLFDSRSADKATVSAACSAIGQVGVPVAVIPGNHDHGGPGSVWEQEFFLREQAALAPNLVVLLRAEPVVVGSAVVLPCPLLHRSLVEDPTSWLRSFEGYSDILAGRPRIVLAHGSTQVFAGTWPHEDEDSPAAGVIDLDRLPADEIDYVALGDWHGTKQVNACAWYAGTPEADRFPKGADQDPGNVLVVDVERGRPPIVNTVKTGRLGWHDISFHLSTDVSLDEFADRMAALLGQRAGEDLLSLTLSGSIGMEAYNRLDKIIESLEARLLRLKLVDQTVLAPSEEEIERLTENVANPLIARVAARLFEYVAGEGEEADVARMGLRELYAASRREAAP